MEDQYPIQPEETNSYDEPSDDDLKTNWRWAIRPFI